MESRIEAALVAIKFGSNGLVPTITQQYDTGQVLMLAWMNRDAVRITLEEGRTCYWSRSRARLWRKGETSGQIQLLRELRLDCDGDAVLLLVDQQGVACHTGRRSCFFRVWREDAWELTTEPEMAPEILYSASGDQSASAAAAGTASRAHKSSAAAGTPMPSCLSPKTPST